MRINRVRFLYFIRSDAPKKKEVCRNENFGTPPFRCVGMSKMQGAEDEDDRSLLT